MSNPIMSVIIIDDDIPAGDKGPATFIENGMEDITLWVTNMTQTCLWEGDVTIALHAYADDEVHGAVFETQADVNTFLPPPVDDAVIVKAVETIPAGKKGRAEIVVLGSDANMRTTFEIVEVFNNTGHSMDEGDHGLSETTVLGKHTINKHDGVIHG
jgi:hypothetical protein